jgi:hypothetical protein
MFPTTSPRRLQRGTRYTAVPENGAGSSQQPPPPSLYNLDSAFQLQEYIAQLVKRDPFDIEAIVRLPSGQTSQQEQNDPSSSSNIQDGPDVDQSCWVYEHLRRLAQDLTYPLITLLQTECTRQSCPEMKAGEWLYLCVAHGNGGSMEVRHLASYIHLLWADFVSFNSNVVQSTISYIPSMLPLLYSTHLATFHLGQYSRAPIRLHLIYRR